MTKPKFDNPEASCAAKTLSIETTIPERMLVYLSLKPDQTVEWITIEKAGERWVEIRRI